MAKYILDDGAGKVATVIAPDSTPESEVMAFSEANWTSWQNGGVYHLGGEEAAPPTGVDPDNLDATYRNTPVPVPTDPAILQQQAAERADRSLLERAGENIRQNTMMGGATDVMNVIGSINPTASTAPLGIATAGKALGRMAGLPVTEAPKAATLAAETLARGAQHGYRVPASEVPGTSVTSRIAEMIGGHGETAAQSALGNQEVTNKVVRHVLGMRPGEQITPAALQEIRKNAGTAYADVKRLKGTLRPTTAYRAALTKTIDDLTRMQHDVPGLEGVDRAIELARAYTGRGPLRYPEAVEAIKNLRHSATKLIASGDPAKEVQGQTAKAIARALDDMLEVHLENFAPEIAGKIRPAREMIAKTHDIEAALNTATGNVNAVKLSRGTDYASGELDDIIQMARGHGKSMREPTGTAVVQKTQPIDVGLGVAGAALGGPVGAAVGFFARPVIRSLMEKVAQVGGPSTKPGQRIMQIIGQLEREYQMRANDPGRVIDEDAMTP